MKLRNHQFSTQPQIFENGDYEHPWYKHTSKSPIMEWRDERDRLIKPNPPTKEAIEKAKFVDKTYEWDRTNNIRPRNKRST
mgnify:FL=1|jgi:hypothetical protein